MYLGKSAVGDITHHPTSTNESNCEVMAGVAVDSTARSRKKRKYANVTEVRIIVTLQPEGYWILVSASASSLEASFFWIESTGPRVWEESVSAIAPGFGM
jgi:hypothetical protein